MHSSSSPLDTNCCVFESSAHFDDTMVTEITNALCVFNAVKPPSPTDYPSPDKRDRSVRTKKREGLLGGDGEDVNGSFSVDVGSLNVEDFCERILHDFPKFLTTKKLATFYNMKESQLNKFINNNFGDKDQRLLRYGITAENLVSRLNENESFSSLASSICGGSVQKLKELIHETLNDCEINDLCEVNDDIFKMKGHRLQKMQQNVAGFPTITTEEYNDIRAKIGQIKQNPQLNGIRSNISAFSK
ncbi:hypothetical protein PCE1_002899 [Barthelona sp. PCE]